MVLAYRGVDRTTREVAELVYDKPHDIFGNWTRAVQAAFTLGVPGYLGRFWDWDEVKQTIAHDQPLVVSIGVKNGELTGAAYHETSGHLIVLCGFDKNGDCLVNDPAAKDAEHGQLTYKRSELQKCWMERGGTAYVLLPRSGTPK